MRNRVMTSVAVLAILAGAGTSYGQSPGGKDAPSGGTATQQSPSTQPHSGSAGPHMNRSQAPDTKGTTPGQNSARSDEGSKGSSRNAEDTQSQKMKGHQSSERSHSDRMQNSQSSEDTHEKNRTYAEHRDAGKNDAVRSESHSKTTGQAGAGAKLSTEQRTKITSVIHEQHVQPEINVNFNISVGTHVPRSVHFHLLPAQIVTIYPDWRGYEFFLVRSQIVVVNPRTLEIVAVLEA